MKTLLNATTLKIASVAKRHGVKKLPKTGSENSAMMKLYQGTKRTCTGTKQTWTSSGSRTKASLTWTTCRILIFLKTR
ncbi:predicted protein [Methanosarcina acetivorans C2A]|uniref:Uncharacterized protein n=1 Tax=Methanosarcina acetivorans (strain ATCC 35395 / DSM 2834 / JCM 12185 / C2A) TaxID=188937 RepID=Q8TTF4_METAC|nr:predicted protein [Methanosarcina acetivorans C2A]